MFILLINLFMSFSLAFAADTPCKTVSIYHRLDTELKLTLETVCFPSASGFMSASCAKGKCGVLSKLEARAIEPESLFSKIGSPDFNLCHAIGGIPQIMAIDSKNLESSRCIDKEDGSFVDLESLFRLYRAKQK